MAEAYGVNRMTVKRAISKLVEEGYLVCKPGSGTYVAQRDKKKIDLDNSNEAGNTGITATLRKGGMEVKIAFSGPVRSQEVNIWDISSEFRMMR